MNHFIDFLLLQLDPKKKVKFSNTLLFIESMEKFGKSLERKLDDVFKKNLTPN
jgi:hypothetical protein